MKSKRIQWLDFVKGVCILMVVMEHSIYFSGVGEYDSNYPEVLLRYLLDVLMMPAFFAISGYLYKPTENIKKYLLLSYKKVISFIIPYVAMYTFFSLCFSQSILQFKMIMNPIKIILHPNGDLWFLWVLFIIFIIVGFMDLLHINKFVQLGVFIILLMIFLLTNSQFLPLKLQHAILQMSNILFFLLGELLRNHSKFIKRNIKRFTMIFYLAFIVMIFTPFYYDPQFISLNTIIPKTLGVFMIFGLAMKMPNNKMFKYFTKYGRYTLIIYVIHFAPLLFFERFLSRIIKSVNFIIIVFKPLITLIIIWSFSVFMCYLIKKIWILNVIFYPRRHIDKYVLKTQWGKRLFDMDL